MDNFERKWELIREQLRVQATGDAPARVSSGRTLFGIKSEAEEKMERFAREIEEENRRKRIAARAHAQTPEAAAHLHGATTDRPEGETR